VTATVLTFAPVQNIQARRVTQSDFSRTAKELKQLVKAVLIDWLRVNKILIWAAFSDSRHGEARAFYLALISEVGGRYVHIAPWE
jgi:hypothetical protein